MTVVGLSGKDESNWGFSPFASKTEVCWSGLGICSRDDCELEGSGDLAVVGLRPNEPGDCVRSLCSDSTGEPSSTLEAGWNEKRYHR